MSGLLYTIRAERVEYALVRASDPDRILNIYPSVDAFKKDGQLFADRNQCELKARLVLIAKDVTGTSQILFGEVLPHYSFTPAGTPAHEFSPEVLYLLQELVKVLHSK